MTADDRLTDADLAAMHLRADAAHPEPWVAQHGVTHDWEEAWWVEDAEGQVLTTLPSHGGLNAAFIAHARTDVPRLVAEVRALRARIAAVEALCDEARGALALPPLDCSLACGDGPCDCSGITRAVAWDLDPAKVRAALRGES